MIYLFQEKSFYRKQVIFSEGQSELDGVYFIKSGEFEVAKKVRVKKEID